MRVALLTREYPPEVYGGAGVHVEHLAPALAAHVAVEVHAFGAPRVDPLVAGVYAPWDALAGDAPELAALRTLSVDVAMAARVAEVDLVHSHTWYTNLAGHLVALVGDVPHVVTSHSLEPRRPWKVEQLGGGYAVARFCERTALEAADAVVAVSQAMRADVLAVYPQVDPDRVHVVQNGVDAEAYRPVEADGVLVRHGVDPERPTVVFVGRITRQKGLPHLLAAARHLSGDAQLVLVAGSPDTPALAGEVRAAVDRLDRDVVWIERMLPRDEVVAFLSHATVFVCPSVYEPFGLVNVEAMACGAPVVASAIGGVPEVVVDGETGLLVPFEAGDAGAPVDPARFARDLAAAIDALLADPHRARQMGEAGRRRVLERFTWPRVAEATVAVYEQVVGAAAR